MGGKSSSSSSAQTTTQTTTATASGTVGDVLQGQHIVINQDLPDTVAQVFKQLVGLTEYTIGVASDAGQKAISAVEENASKASQPDLETLSQSQKTAQLAIAGAAVLAAVIVWRMMK